MGADTLFDISIIVPIGACVGRLADVETNVVAVVFLVLEFIVKVESAVEVSPGVWSVTVIDTALGIGTEVDATCSVGVIAALDLLSA